MNYMNWKFICLTSIVFNNNDINLLFYSFCINFSFSHNQSINIGPNVKIVMHIPEEYFKVLNTVNNGSYVIVQPIKLGTPNIKASLVEPYHDDTSAITTMSIYSKVKITPDEVVFPWHANQNSG